LILKTIVQEGDGLQPLPAGKSRLTPAGPGVRPRRTCGLSVEVVDTVAVTWRDPPGTTEPDAGLNEIV
jgi:hypothetical protein